MKKIILGAILFLGLCQGAFAAWPYTLSGQTTGFSVTALWNNVSFQVAGDQTLYANYFTYSTGWTHTQLNGTLCTGLYVFDYNNINPWYTTLTCWAGGNIFELSPGLNSTPANFYTFLPLNAPVTPPTASMQAVINSFGSGTLAAATATGTWPIGTMLYVIIGIIVFIGVAGLVVFAFKKFINK